MKKTFFLLLLALFTCAAHAIKDDTYIAVDREGVTIEVKGNRFMVKHIRRDNPYNTWTLYRITPDGANLRLEGIAEFRESGNHAEMLRSVPEDAMLTYADSSTPTLTGKYASKIEKSLFGVFNDSQEEMMKSIIDWKEYPEEYDPDSVAGLTTNAYALVESYREIAGSRWFQDRQTLKKHDSKKMNGNAKLILFILIPLLASMVLGPMLSGGSVAENTWQKTKWVAITQVVGLICIVIAVCGFYTWWVWVVLGVVGILIIQVYNIFFAWFVRDHLVETTGQKFPMIRAFVFGVLATYILCGWIFYTVVLINGVKIENVGVGDTILGMVLGVALLVAVSMWYRKALVKRFPETEGHFLLIAILTVFGVMGVCVFIIFFIIWILFKGTGKMFLAESQKEDPAGLGPVQKGGVSCATCGRLGDNRCPYYLDRPEGGMVCGHWEPK